MSSYAVFLIECVGVTLVGGGIDDSLAEGDGRV